MAGYYGFTLDACLYVRPSVRRTSVFVFLFFVFCLFVVVVFFLFFFFFFFFSFLDDGLSKCQWVFTKLGVCIDIVAIWFMIANRQISSIFDSYLLASVSFDRGICPNMTVVGYYRLTFYLYVVF